MSENVLSNTQRVDRKENSLRKSNKPLMERRRRERINICLTQLKSLVLQGMKKDSSQFSKLEKADILEMTVKHLRTVQRQQISSVVASDPEIVTKYRAGFHECANEVVRYLSAAQGVSDDVRSRLVGHLVNRVQTVNTPHLSQQNQQLPAQPLQVRIPIQQTPMQQVPSGHVLMNAHAQQHVTANANSQNQCLSTTATTSPHSQKTHFTGSYQLIPGNGNGPFAVYLGHTNENVVPNTTVPVYTLQVSSPPIQKNSNYSPAPSAHELDTDSEKQRAHSVENSPVPVSPVCSSGNTSLTDEHVWRPW